MRQRFETQVDRPRRAGARWTRRIIGIGAAVVVSVVAAPGLASAAPVNPSDTQISAAAQAKQAAADRVGAITAQLAQAQTSADASHQAAQIALQDYEDTQAAYETATATAEDAAAAADAAEAALAQGRADVRTFARASYMQGSTDSGLSALLSSGGPADLLERAALLDAAGTHHTDVVAELTVLEDQATAADAVAQQALTAASALKDQAADALAGAQAQEIAARREADALSAQQAGLQAELQQAQQELYGLQGAREAAEAYAAAQAAAAAAVPAPTPVRVVTPSAGTSTRAPAGSSSSGTPTAGTPTAGTPTAGTPTAGTPLAGRPAPSTPSTPVPSSGGSAGAPSASAAQTAISAARSQLGVLYSWGGGGSSGPSYGISPDTSVYGFDCSGLTQYAYARAGIAIGGTSRDQWWNNRSKQVSASDLRPGDLLFWASGNAYTSIYHVALYIGDSRMIEAPDRGLRVTTSSLRFGGDYFGAVRPSA